jgi:hypothetical protein
VTARNGVGRAAFRRVGDHRVVLELAVDAGPLQARTTGLGTGAVYDAIEALREADVRRMKQVLGDLAAGLTTQLCADGARVAVDLHPHAVEERHGAVHGDTVTVAGTSTRMRTDLSGVEGVSDAYLVQATIAAAVRARERAIREAYEQMLLDRGQPTALPRAAPPSGGNR